MALFSMNVEDMPEFRNPDPGEYDAVITKVEETTSKKGDPMLVFYLSINSEDPDVNGSKVCYYHMVPDSSSEHYNLQLKSTRSFCEALGVNGNPEADDFINLECRILLENRESDDGSVFSSVKRFLK